MDKPRDYHKNMSHYTKAEIASYIADIIERRIVNAPPMNPVILAIVFRNEAGEQIHMQQQIIQKRAQQQRVELVVEEESNG